jgi:hypothetical protein
VETLRALLSDLVARVSAEIKKGRRGVSPQTAALRLPQERMRAAMATTRGLTTAVIAFFALTIGQFVTPSAAAAQSAPRLAIGASAGLSIPLHGDFDFTAPEWQISLRTTVSDHVALEGFFEQWRHATDEVRTNVTLQGPASIVGHAGRISSRTLQCTRIAGFNALARASFDRVTLTAGGGPSIWLYERRFSQTLSDCESTQPNGCRDFASRFSNSSFSVQAVAGLDVALTSRLAAFGQYQLAAPTVDISGGHSSVGAGVRLRVW